ncbi:MAG: class I SAM-dependent methyltransferase, partial [Blastocatellia bacterium]
MFLVDRLRPKTIVELGTFSGVSYCAFCQTVKELSLPSRCYAVDTWEGDPQTGFFGPEVLEDLKQHHDPLYGGFSTLIESTFDEAARHFSDSTIDLLHIDGYHTYDVVKHDFENWLPKVSPRGVVLMHDINVRERDFGVWKLWGELRQRYPHFELIHEHGLGLLAVGENYDPGLRELFELPESDRALIRQFFSQLGQRLKVRLEKDHAVSKLSWQVDDKQKIIESLTPQLEQKDEAIEWLTAQVKEKEQASAHLTAQVQSLSLKATQRQGAIEWLTAQVKEKEQASAHLTAQVQSLSLKATQRQGAIESLSAELTKQREMISGLGTRLSTRDRAIDNYSAQIGQKEKVIRSQEEGIAWLRGEVAEAQKKSQRLASSNELLKGELSRKERQKQVLSARLEDVETRLEQTTNSLGWRLLSYYGRLKYPYLLPIYRLLGLMPRESKTAEPKTIAILDAGISEVEQIVGSQLQDQPGAAERQLFEGLAEGERGAPDQQPGFDFYESLTIRPRLLEEELAAILEKRPPESPVHRPDVICFSIIDWEFRYQRPQQIMSQFAANGHRVFYISTSRFQPGTAVPRVRVSALRENVYEVQLAVERPVDVYGEVLEGANKTAVLASLDELRHTFHIDEAIGYVMIASWGEVALSAKELWDWRVLYDCMDEWENFPGIKRALLDMEVELVRGCDLLVVTGQLLFEKWKRYGRPIVVARNAVDWDFYAEHCRPNTILTEVQHPVIGYYGAIADWFDIELLTEAARRRPEYTFVLLGGVFDVDVTKLKALPNVRLLGQQPYETMPQYLYHFDACMIPFKINPITEATDPVKVYEYLSAGKPVVTVALPELELLHDYLY